MALGQFTANALRMGDLQRIPEREAAQTSRTATPVDAFREQMARESQNREAAQAQVRRESSPKERAEPTARRESKAAPQSDTSAGPDETSTRSSTAPPQAGRATAERAAPGGAQTPESAAANTMQEGAAGAKPCAAEDAPDGGQAQEDGRTGSAKHPVPTPVPGVDALPAAMGARSAGKPQEIGVARAHLQPHPGVQAHAAVGEADEGLAAAGHHEPGGSKTSTAERANSPDPIRAPIACASSGTLNDGTLRSLQRADASLTRLPESTSPDGTLQFRLSASADSPAFASQLGDRVGLMLRAGTGEARLILHPEALGTVAVSLKVKDSEANVVFSTGTEAARAALDAALPQLKELLASQGVQLASASTHMQFDDRYSGRDASQFSQFSRGGHEQHRQSADWRPASLREAILIDGTSGVPADLRGTGSGRLSIFA